MFVEINKKIHGKKKEGAYDLYAFILNIKM